MRTLEALYAEGRNRIVELVAGADPDAVHGEVPACPAWSVHDVVSHLTGLCADVVAGNVAGAATDAWTDVQVQARRGWSTADVLTEWQAVGPQLAGMLDDFPGRYGRQVIADLAVHEHDIRGALDAPGARDSRGVEEGLDFLVSTVAHPGAAALGLEPIRVTCGTSSWVVGSDEAVDADPDQALFDAIVTDTAPPPAATPAVSVEVPTFDFFRALSGRRSAEQIRRFDWSADADAYLPLFSLGPFTVRPTDLDE